jgi:hypothetical protein
MDGIRRPAERPGDFLFGENAQVIGQEPIFFLRPRVRGRDEVAVAGRRQPAFSPGPWATGAAHRHRSVPLAGSVTGHPHFPIAGFHPAPPATAHGGQLTRPSCLAQHAVGQAADPGEVTQIRLIGGGRARFQPELVSMHVQRPDGSFRRLVAGHPAQHLGEQPGDGGARRLPVQPA